MSLDLEAIEKESHGRVNCVSYQTEDSSARYFTSTASGMRFEHLSGSQDRVDARPVICDAKTDSWAHFAHLALLALADCSRPSRRQINDGLSEEHQYSTERLSTPLREWTISGEGTGYLCLLSAPTQVKMCEVIQTYT